VNEEFGNKVEERSGSLFKALIQHITKGAGKNHKELPRQITGRDSKIGLLDTKQACQPLDCHYSPPVLSYVKTMHHDD